MRKMSEIQNDLNKVKRNIEFHISIHHLGESAEVCIIGRI